MKSIDPVNRALSMTLALSTASQETQAMKPVIEVMKDDAADANCWRYNFRPLCPWSISKEESENAIARTQRLADAARLLASSTYWRVNHYRNRGVSCLHCNIFISDTVGKPLRNLEFPIDQHCEECIYAITVKALAAFNAQPADKEST
jgi:hypothetical protein